MSSHFSMKFPVFLLCSLPKSLSDAEKGLAQSSLHLPIRNPYTFVTIP